MSRRSFVASAVGLATTFQLQRTAWALGFAADQDVCRLMPEQEVGPYYVADELLRSNIGEGKPGIPLALSLILLDARNCEPLRNAAIDIWHCDALGLYSGFSKMNAMGPGGPGAGGPDRGGQGGPPPGFDPSPPGNRPGPPAGFGPPPAPHTTDKLTFLRGIQMTDDHGRVSFETVFPGFYMGRTNHIHFKVRLGGHAAAEGAGHPKGQTYAAGHTSHVGQVFFPESLAMELMKHPPYSLHEIHRTTQAEDGVFSEQHGAESMATVTFVRAGDASGGLRAELVAAVDPTATPAPAGRMGPPPSGSR